MKRILLSALLLSATLLPATAATLNLPDVPAARQQAATAKKPIIIIWYGSDWQPGVDAFVSDWQAAATRHSGSYVFGQFNDCLGLEGDTRNKVLPIEHFNLPAVILLAPDGSFMSVLSGENLPSSAEDAVKKLAPLAARAADFATLAEKARTSTGTAAAQAAAQALSMLPISDAMRQKELKNIINRQDPQNTTGYRAQFCLDHLGMYDEINAILKGGREGKLSGKDRRFDEAEAYVRGVLNSPQLSADERRQQWLSGLSYVIRERILSTTTPENRNVEPLLAVFREIIAINPENQYGKGAAAFLHYWDPSTYNTITNGYYTRGHQTLNFEKDWHVDVTSSIQGPGTYVFSLVPVENGRLICRNYRLAVNGNVVATAAIPPTQDTKSVELQVPTIPQGATVEVWLTAKCTDGWMEASGFIRMEKK